MAIPIYKSSSSSSSTRSSGSSNIPTYSRASSRKKEDDKKEPNFATRGLTEAPKQTFEVLSTLAQLGSRAAVRLSKDITSPIDEGIPDIIEHGIPNVLETGKAVGRGFGEFRKFLGDIPGARRKAKEGIEQLKAMPEKERFEAIRSVEDKIYQGGGKDSTAAKFVGATGLAPALSLMKGTIAPKETFAQEPVYTAIDALTLGKVTGVNKIVKASAKELGNAGIEQLAKGELGPTIDLYKQKLKLHTDKKEYSQLDIQRTDEWFDHHTEILNDFHGWFDATLTKKEKRLYSAYAKGTLKTPDDISENLRLALDKGREIGKLNKDKLIVDTGMTQKMLDERSWGPLRVREAKLKYNKTLDQLTEAQKVEIDGSIARIQEQGIVDPFFYSAIRKNKTFTNVLFPKASKTSKSTPGLFKKYTGVSEFSPEEFYQSPFQVMTRTQIAMDRYFFNRDALQGDIKKYGKKFDPETDTVAPGHVVVAPEGYTKLFQGQKSDAHIIDNILNDDSVDLSILFGKDSDEILAKMATNTGSTIEEIVKRQNTMEWQQIPKFVADNWNQKLATKTWKSQLRQAEDLVEVMDIIKSNAWDITKFGINGGLLKVWKKAVLGYYPVRFVKNNLIGALVFSAMQGIKPSSFVKSRQIKKGTGVFGELKEETKLARQAKKDSIRTKEQSIISIKSELETIDNSIKSKLDELSSSSTQDKVIQKEIDTLNSLLEETSNIRNENLTTFFKEGDTESLSELGRRLGTLPDRLQVVSAKVKSYKTYDAFAKSDDFFELNKLHINGDLSRAGFASPKSFFNTVQNPFKPKKTVTSVKDQNIALKRSIKSQTAIDRLKEKLDSVTTIDKRSINDSLRILEQEIHSARSKKELLTGDESTLREARQSELQELADIRDFLPKGVEQGFASTSANSLIKKLYDVDDALPKTKQAWLVFKEGMDKTYNWLPNKTFKAAEAVENFFRRASFYNEASKLAEGAIKKSGKELNPQSIIDEIATNVDIQRSALEQTNKFFGNYTKKIGTAGDVFPFYRFYKHVFNLAVRYPLEFPERSLLIKNASILQEQIDEEIQKTAQTPEYLQARNNIPITLKGAEFRLRVTSEDPFGALDLTNVKPIEFVGFEPVDLLLTAALRQTSPSIKVATERVKGEELFRQRPFKYEWADEDEAENPDLWRHIARQIPQFNDFQKIADTLVNYHKTGKFEVPSRDIKYEVTKDKNDNAKYTKDWWIEVLKPLGISIVEEQEYQRQVESALKKKR